MRTSAQIIRGTSKTLFHNAVDDYGAPRDLTHATLELLVQLTPTDGEPLIEWRSTDVDPKITAAGQRVTIVFAPADTASLELGSYVFQVKATMPDGNIYIIIEWSPLAITLGGVATPTIEPFGATTVVNHNFGSPDSLRYVTPGNDGIEDAHVRIYRKSDYDAGNFTSPVAVSMTNSDGRWRVPVLLTPGNTYVIHFQKSNAFGPDVREIII